VASGKIRYVLGTATERLAAACRGMILSRPEYSTGSTREPPGFPAFKGTLFAKNRHDNVVSVCFGSVQVVHWVYDRRTEGLDVCLWVSLIGPMAEEVREEDSGDEVGRR
jgi:hypothetical protein